MLFLMEMKKTSENCILKFRENEIKFEGKKLTSKY